MCMHTCICSELCAAGGDGDDYDDEAPLPPLEQHRSPQQSSETGDDGSTETETERDKDPQWIAAQLEKLDRYASHVHCVHVQWSFLYSTTVVLIAKINLQGVSAHARFGAAV